MQNNYNCTIPADVPQICAQAFADNFCALTKGTNNLLIFSADQKIEHLNQDFHSPDVPAEVNNPEHLFSIAAHSNVSGLATQLGLITRYGRQYPDVTYIAKLTSKTNLIPRDAHDPMSAELHTVRDVITIIEQTGLAIRAVGSTVYLGSEFEHLMLSQAAQMVFDAHQHGLVAIIWMYPRGAHVPQQLTGELVAGAAGVAAALGADVVKVPAPHPTRTHTSAQLLEVAVQAAGNTKVVVSGGPLVSHQEFLARIGEQLSIGKTAGCAIGRNIFQRTTADAIAYANQLADLVFHQKVS